MSHAFVPNSITLLGHTLYRNTMRPFGIKQVDRRTHIAILGRSGCGKSTLLESIIRQDISAGRALGLLDPHGDLAQSLYKYASKHSSAKVIYFDAGNDSHQTGFNPLSNVPTDKHSLAVAGILQTFQHLWPGGSIGPRTEHLLRHCLFTLFERPFSTLTDTLRLLTEAEFRKKTIPYLSRYLQQFWTHEFEKYPARLRAEAVAPLQNKLGALLADPRLRAILSQPTSSFDVRQVMDQGHILIVNLSRGIIGGDAAALLGALLVSHISVIGLSRADIPEHQRRDFSLFIDEAQVLANESLALILAELRKYRVSLVMANQYLSQLPESVRESILGTVGTLVAFRVGISDADLLAREFAPVFDAEDLLNLPNYSFYLKLMVDGRVTRPFSAITTVTNTKINPWRI